MDIANVPVDTCPLCNERALSWSGTTCVCRACDSTFEADPETRRCRYTRVAAEYAAAEPALVADWLTRREVFERAESALSAQPIRPARGAPSPLVAVWAVLVGALLLIPFLCACLSALLLGPGIAQTRQLIAAANAPVAVLTHALTVTSDVMSTQNPSLINPLDSPLQTPTSAGQLTTPDQPVMTATGIDVSPAFPPTITVEIITSTGEASVIPTETRREVPTLPPQKATATLPATFTPAPPGVVGTATPIPSPNPSLTAMPTAIVQPTSTVQMTTTAVPTSTVVVTLTVTATPTLVAVGGCTSTVVISTVMYTGTASLNQSDQYVEIFNRASQPVNMSNWTVRALSSERAYVFPNGLNVQGGQACRIYTNSPQNYGNCGALSFYSSSPDWSNTSDKAELRDNLGMLICLYQYNTTPN